MQNDWNDNQPIYIQLREKVVGLILDEVLKDGDALPSVRTVSADYRVNPITVSKAYQTLVDDQVITKKRGLGMFVEVGAKAMLLESEKQKFINQEWPEIRRRIERLGLSADDLLSKNNSEGTNDE